MRFVVGVLLPTLLSALAWRAPPQRPHNAPSCVQRLADWLSAADDWLQRTLLGDGGVAQAGLALYAAAVSCWWLCCFVAGLT